MREAAGVLVLLMGETRERVEDFPGVTGATLPPITSTLTVLLDPPTALVAMHS